MGSGGVAIAALPTVICLKVPFSDGLGEGIAYITGAVFYSLNKKRFMHTVFHFFVLLGSLCHIIAVWDILMEYL